MSSENRIMTSLRLTPEAKAILQELAKKQGISQAAIVELLVRQEAKKQEKKNA